ncbi:MAG: efflux RND transporter periplasmic adaptor subunit [Myxococcales bacterium]
MCKKPFLPEVDVRTRLLVLTLSFSIGCGASKGAPPPAAPPPTVYVATVARQDLPLLLEAVGALDGYVNADIRARVKGYLDSQRYKDGSFVREGQILFTVEAAEQSAALAAAQANVARAKAAQARNRAQLARSEDLFKSGVISQQELDNARAAVADTDGQVLVAGSSLRQAQLNLSYTQIRSPIPGIAGSALVRVGNLVGQDGPTLLATVSQLDPVRVNFPMSEVEYVRHPDRFRRLDQRDLAWAKRQFARLDARGKEQAEGGDDPGLALVLSDGSVYPHRGVVVAVNRQIDASTGTIQVQALVPNPDLLLRPGQYARVRIERQNEGHDVIAVPEKALISVQGTYSLGVVGQDNKVQLRRVEVGPSAAGKRIIVKGLQEGERVVVEGVQKISDGAAVDPKPAPVAQANAGQEPGGAASVRK